MGQCPPTPWRWSPQLVRLGVNLGLAASCSGPAGQRADILLQGPHSLKETWGSGEGAPSCTPAPPGWPPAGRCLYRPGPRHLGPVLPKEESTLAAPTGGQVGGDLGHPASLPFWTPGAPLGPAPSQGLVHPANASISRWEGSPAGPGLLGRATPQCPSHRLRWVFTERHALRHPN